MHLVWFHFLHSISSWLRNREKKNVTGWECAPIDVVMLEGSGGVVQMGGDAD